MTCLLIRCEAMWLDEWNKLKLDADEIYKLAEQDDWAAVSSKGDKLEKDLLHFFDETLPEIENREKPLIKEEGEMLISNILGILTMAKRRRGELKDETGKLAKGSRGISAYKKI